MVSIAAFLVICVILFGLDNVRTFVFGTMGFIGWTIAIVVLLSLLIVGINKVGEALEERKKAKAEGKKVENDGTVGLLIFLALVIAGVFVYRQFFAPKYNVLYRFTNGSWAIDKSLSFGNESECKLKASSLNLDSNMFEYKCGKNCEADSSNIYISKCEEMY